MCNDDNNDDEKDESDNSNKRQTNRPKPVSKHHYCLLCVWIAGGAIWRLLK